MLFSTTILSLAALSTTVLAAPSPWNNNGKGNGRNWGKDRDCKNGPFEFTSTYNIVATPDQVVNGTTPTGGLPGAIGYYNFGINSDKDLICWSITLNGFRGNYQSPARTATHIHQAAKGASGPPRLAFPNPVGDEKEAISVGCMTGPFTTGVSTNGVDSGAGFKVKQIEDDPAAFFADVHSSLAVPGAVRGQLA
ncbi:hypothetical protein LTR78_005901 [Recurvomyces mirabilis]|uniref:CHRD domain-containing protein n=1 Tax=Recurvomyces mirabilis TaxID=574656 RepID=A0AAE0WLQ9_9PEZI|nr:hypothetical protein LTR78_005901 [Recurvomyces mirabilis]KAK5155290.1 hypothetical protein LTS14_006245 [Recurvomyces mirabilis]